MRRAMAETERRRTKQMQFNEAHGITPRGVSKRIKDIIDGVYDSEASTREVKAAQRQAVYSAMNEKQLAKEIKRLEKEMGEYAKNLEFEKAAVLRDQINELRKGVGEPFFAGARRGHGDGQRRRGSRSPRGRWGRR